MLPAKWIERNFIFGLTPILLPNMLTRLSGTEIRMMELASSLTAEQLNFRKDGRWSIKEHLGHLCDLEDLHEGRIDDLISRKKILRPADMSNERTNAEEYNSKNVEEIIRKFSQKRRKFISRLEHLDDSIIIFSAHHERMGKMMNPVDLAYFTAEHDDHHLTYVRDICDYFNT